MAKFKIRLMRSISHETEVEVVAPTEDAARREAMDKARFLIWEHRNRAEYEVLWIRPSSDDEEETKFG